ncbi:hypothetical protein RHMOL_Rhmol11G0005100 [Rhododendron molle]|uniref:Uncharacterized protein n=1 Tax=Rhododendron molle TaxID=49168 RepID=A0ACC0LMH2_RHOML|nr:hypothetical protein RHMOL_Rhmol11G0005100 [Rhododendron molle]
MEVEERAGAEAQWPRVTAVAEVGKLTCPEFLAEAYVPPTYTTPVRAVMLCGLRATTDRVRSRGGAERP